MPRSGVGLGKLRDAVEMGAGRPVDLFGDGEVNVRPGSVGAQGVHEVAGLRFRKAADFHRMRVAGIPAFHRGKARPIGPDIFKWRLQSPDPALEPDIIALKLLFEAVERGLLSDQGRNTSVQVA